MVNQGFQVVSFRIQKRGCQSTARLVTLPIETLTQPPAKPYFHCILWHSRLTLFPKVTEKVSMVSGFNQCLSRYRRSLIKLLMATLTQPLVSLILLSPLTIARYFLRPQER